MRQDIHWVGHRVLLFHVGYACRAASVAGALCESSWRWRGLRMAFMSTTCWGTKAAIGFWKYCKYLTIKRSRVMLPRSCLLYFVFEIVTFHWRYASCIQCRTGCLWLAGRANLSESQQHQQETQCRSVNQACSGYLLLFDCMGCCSRNFPLHLTWKVMSVTFPYPQVKWYFDSGGSLPNWAYVRLYW